MQRIGDAVFSLTAINSIIKYHKQKIIIFCYSSSRDVFKFAFPGIELIELTSDDFYFNKKFAKSKVREIVEKLHPDRIYDLCGSITTASILLTLPTKELIGVSQQYFKSIYSHYTLLQQKPHISQIYTDAIKDIVPIEDFEISHFAGKEPGFFLVHPFAGWKAKEWGLNKFLQLTCLLNKYSKCYLLIPGNSLTNDTLEEIKNKNIDFIVTRSTQELIEVIKECSFFIGNDSGPVQIANLLGKPSFTIYGPTNPDMHKPLKGENRYIIKKLDCSPKEAEKWCHTYGGMINCPSFECMNLLEYDEVENAVIEYLNELRLITK